MFAFVREEDEKEFILFAGCFASLIPMGALVGSHLMMGVAMSSFNPDAFSAFHPWMKFSTLLSVLCLVASFLIFWRLYKTEFNRFWGSFSIVLQWVPLLFFWVGFMYFISDFH